MRSALGRAWTWIAAAGMLLCTSYAWAQTSPEIQRGIAWLQSQVASDGSLVSEATSIATAEQARAEVLNTLAVTASAPVSLIAALDQNNPAATENVARHIAALSAAGQNVVDAANALAASQNNDGGYGFQSPYRSNPLDTAFALIALPFAGNANGHILAALTWLIQSRHSDGGYGVSASSQIYTTAYVLLAAQAHTGLTASSQVAAGAREWLLAQRNSGRYDSSLDNAMALLALLSQTTDAAILQPIADALRAVQAPSGSWDDDPFVTALALRALWQAGQPATVPTTGRVTGQIADSNGTALTDATVMLLEASEFVATTGGDGSFTISGIRPGSYTLQASKLGYTAKTMTITITSGASLSLGTVKLATASLGATLTGRITESANHTGLAGVIVAAGTLSTLTDTQGNYQLTGINPGSGEASATLPGYRVATAPIVFISGATHNFSPSLVYANWPEKTVTSLQGKLVDSVSGTGIVGASVKFGDQSTTTAAKGVFAFTNLVAGSYGFSASATGYASINGSVTVVKGDNDLGNVAMAASSVASYKLTGVISDVVTGSPISGARIVVAGTSLSATSGADGRYELVGLSQATAQIAVSANGYLGMGYDVSFAQAGSSILDIVLTPAVASGIDFLDVRTGMPEYGPDDEVKFYLTVRNATSAATDLVIVAEVYDQNGSLAFVAKANAVGTGIEPFNMPILFPAGASQPFEFGTYLQRQSAGTYRVVLRGSNTSGRAMAQGTASFSVRAQSLLAGGIVLDPPLAQAGTQQPIAIKAELKNSGNLPILDGALTLTVTLDRADTTVRKAEVGMNSVLRSSVFKSARGLVADTAGNFFTVNAADRKIIKIDLAGTTSEFAVLPSGAYPVDIAIDGQGNLWIANSSGKVWRVTPQAAITEFAIDARYGLNGIDIDVAGNLYLTASRGANYYLLRRDPQGQLVELIGNGLNRPTGIVKDIAGGMIVANAGSGNLSRIGADGRISEFVRGLSQPWGMTQDAAGNLYVADFGVNTVVKVTPAGVVSTYATGLAGPTDLKFDNGGNLYVSNRTDHTIVRIRADGTKEVFARGIAMLPQGMKYDSAGNLYIANEDGTLRKKDASDNVSVLSTQLKVPRGLAVDAQGNVYVANSGNGTVSKVSPTGTTVFASGLVASPYGVAVGGAGEIYVSTQNDWRIHIFDAMGNRTGAIEPAISTPNQILVDAADSVYVLNNGYIGKIEAGVQKYWASLSASYMALDPSGGLVAASGSLLYRVSATGTVGASKSTGVSIGGLAVMFQ